MMQMRMGQVFRVAALAVCAGMLLPPSGWAQPDGTAPAAPAGVNAVLEQPDAQSTREQLSALFQRYPPALRNVLALDPSLLSNQAYLAPYPALANFLKAHPEVALNATFYLGEPNRGYIQDRASQALNIWRDAMQSVIIFIGFGMAIGLLVWLIRTLIDYRRWSRLTRVQTEVHTKLLDRFTGNEDLLSYIQSPAGARFLQSSPIALDAAPRSVGAPLGRILWSVQGGVVLMAAGIGLWVVSGRIPDAAQPFQALGILGLALGLGFVISAIISFVISRRLGLIEPPPGAQTETPGA